MRLRSLPGLLLLVAAALFAVPSAVGFYTDWLWFDALGYEGIFLRTLNAQVVVFAATFAAVFLFLYGNLRHARRRAAARPRMVLGTSADGRPIAVEGRQIAGLALPVSLAVAFLLALASAGDWQRWLSFFNASPFGERDPLLGHEVAFYVFQLPVYQTVQQQAQFVSIFSLIGCLLYYVFTGSFVIEARPGSSWPRIRLTPSARRHLSLLAALVFGLLACGAWLEIPRTLLTPTTSVVAFGASYADVHAGIPFLWVSIVVLVAGVGLAVWHGFGGRAWSLPVAVVLYLAVSVSGGLYGSFIQRFRVTPDEQNMEQPFILNNIASTRLAYGLDRVEERELTGDAELSPVDVVDNAATIENVRLWDHDVLLQTFGQLQEIRTYYDFVSVDNDRYMIDGKLRQVMLSVRELNTDALPNPSWVNDRLKYTHGYGLTLGPVNQVTTEGLPVLFIRDLPPVSTLDLGLERPAVYYGELSNSYAIVGARDMEFDYPRGQDNEETYYDGSGGVPVGSLPRRILFAIRFSSTDILVSDQITPESRIMFHRRIGERARMLAPFLSFDFDPYPVVSEGHLYWMQDAYTVTANYPYSTPRARPLPAVNYIRNSVKIVTDAYDGSVTFYLADPEDPLVRTIDQIFPGMLKPLAEMPADLRQHIRYPEELFRTQALVYQTYHMTNPVVFYGREDEWQVPVIESAQNSATMQPYYAMMRLPGETQAEFIQMLPFTPRAKDNLAAWMVARSDGDNYGRLVVFQFPKQKIVYGPRQIVGRINQNQIISPQVTLWDQQGSEVLWGTLLVIPVNESLLYVRPLYLRSTQGGIPELKQVVVAYQNQIVMAETLNRALVRIFGQGVAASLAPDRLAGATASLTSTADGEQIALATAPAEPAGVDLATLAAEAKAHMDRAEQAQRAGDWALYGEEIRGLSAVIEKMLQAR